MGLFNTMFSVTQQCHKTPIAVTERVHQPALLLVTFCKQRFLFAMTTPNVHQMCAHLWGLFQMTKEQPISRYAEESQEA